MVNLSSAPDRRYIVVPISSYPALRDTLIHCASIPAMARAAKRGHPSTGITFEPSLYPRTYSTSMCNRLVWISLAAVVSVGGLLGVLHFGTGHETRGLGGSMVMVLVSLVFVVLGGYLILLMLRFKVILKPDAIEVRNIFSTRILPRDEIAGRRILLTQYISTLELIPGDQEKKKLRIGMMMSADASFHSWFAAIPDLDAKDLAKSESQITSELEFGLTPEQRSEFLVRARKIVKWLNGIASAICVWGLFYPRPYQLVISLLITLPLIVVVILVRSQGLYQIEGRRNDARPSLATAFLFPAAILALRTIHDANFLRWMPFLAGVITANFLLTLVVTGADRGIRERRWAMFSIFLLGAMYVYGSFGQADMLLDRSAPETFEVATLSKRVSNGRSTTWYIRVAPWGPQVEATDVSVSRSFYNSIVPGDTVCIGLFPGALRIPWYFVRNCH